jgi:hypothetical protein
LTMAKTGLVNMSLILWNSYKPFYLFWHWHRVLWKRRKILAPLTFDKFATSAIGWLDPKVMVFVA